MTRYPVQAQPGVWAGVSCPECASMMRPVGPTSPLGARHRVAGLVLECTGCRHVATLVVQLLDGVHGRLRVAS